MKIVCIANTGDALPKIYHDSTVYRTAETKFKLTVGKEYIVYAVAFWQSQVWYYICDDNYLYYPQKHCGPLFATIDRTVSSLWEMQVSSNGLLELACEVWLNDPYFYDKLTDGETEAIEIWENLKADMDKEAAQPLAKSKIANLSLLTAK